MAKIREINKSESISLIIELTELGRYVMLISIKRAESLQYSRVLKIVKDL